MLPTGECNRETPHQIEDTLGARLELETESTETAINLLYNRLDGLPIQTITGDIEVMQKSEYEKNLEEMSDEELIKNTKNLEQELKEIEKRDTP